MPTKPREEIRGRLRAGKRHETFQKQRVFLLNSLNIKKQGYFPPEVS